MANYTVSSGVVSSGITLNGGDSLTVLSGGVASATTVNSGGTDYVSSGGVAVGTTVNFIGNEIVSSGGVASGATVSGGGGEVVDSGGLASGVTVDNGGVDAVLYGGTAIDTTLNSGGDEDVQSGGVASGTTVSGGIEFVFSGGVASVTTVNSAGKEDVYGTAISTTVNSGGVADVFSAGVASGTTVNVGGEEVVFSAGVTSGTTVTSGGTEVVASGGTASGATVNFSGFEYVLGVASGTTVNDLGTEIVSSGGVANSTTVNSGGTETVSAGGVASGTTVTFLGTEVVSSGGVATGTTVNAGTQIVSSGGVATGTTVNSRGFEVVSSGGVTSGATVSNSGIEVVSTGGVASDTTLNLEGFENVLSGGVATETTVNFGGVDDVYSGGVAIGTTVNSGGLEVVSCGGVTSGTTVSADGTEFVFSGGAASAAMVNSGTEKVFSAGLATDTTINGGLLDLAVDATASGAITFGAGSGTLEIDGTTMPGATIGGFSAGDTIDLAAVAYDPSGAANLGAGNVLTINEGDQSYTLQFDPTEDFSGEYFHLGGDGTAVTLSDVPCYLAGTLIATDRGEVAVEQLAIDDRVLTRDGACKPIKWIGQRSYAGLFAATNARAQPILIRRGALGDRKPRRDLYVSADHAVYLRDVLIPAGALVNGASIVAAEDIDPICYFHVELESHDVIFAEGAAAESFVDCHSRLMFQNAAAFATLYPDDRRPSWAFCAPRIEDGFVFELVRRELAERAGLSAPAAPEIRQCGPLGGVLETATRERITGWALQLEHSDSPVVLEILDGDSLLRRVVAGTYRSDLAEAGCGNGRSGFDVHLSRPLAAEIPHEIVVRRAADKMELARITIPPATHLAEARASLTGAVRIGLAAAATTTDLDALLADLTRETDTARQARARLLAGAPKRRGERPGGARALVIDDRLPDAARDAGSNAILSHIGALQRLGYRVEFAASDLEVTGPAAVSLAAAGVVLHGHPAVASVEEVLRRAEGGYAAIYLHRLANAEAYAAQARRHHPRARILYAVADLHWLRTERRGVVEQWPGLLAESRRLRQRELLAMRQADAVLTHSTHEAALLRHALPGALVHVVPGDAPVRQNGRRAFVQRNGVAFLGHYGHAPNLDAANWLITEIMPRVWQQEPTIPCLLAGSAMPERLAEWAGRDKRIAVLGHVAKLSDLFDRIRLTVAPLRYGAGVKGKVLDSFTAGVVCVMSPIAAEGLALPPALRQLVGQDAQEMAALICCLHGDQKAQEAAARAGRAMLRQHWTGAHVEAALRDALALTQGHRGRAVMPARLRRAG